MHMEMYTKNVAEVTQICDLLQTLQPDPKQNSTFHYHLKSLAQIQYLRFQLHQYYKQHSPSMFGKFEIGLVKTYLQLMPTRGTFYKIIDLIRKFTIIQHLKPVTVKFRTTFHKIIVYPTLYVSATQEYLVNFGRFTKRRPR